MSEFRILTMDLAFVGNEIYVFVLVRRLTTILCTTGKNVRSFVRPHKKLIRR